MLTKKELRTLSDAQDVLGRLEKAAHRKGGRGEGPATPFDYGIIARSARIASSTVHGAVADLAISGEDGDAKVELDAHRERREIAAAAKRHKAAVAASAAPLAVAS